jgi:uncharacterized protein YndB with AHSA1/START domain
MTTEATTHGTVQVYRVSIRASAQAIWDAITTPEWTARYGYGAPCHYDLRPGGAYRSLATPGMKEYGAPDVVVEGEVLEVDPPHRLVQTWRMLFSPELTAEALTRLTWEIEEGADGVCTLTITHDLAGAPAHAGAVSGTDPRAGGGWPGVLDDLKLLLETGASKLDAPDA